jgi:dTDP-glucose 4,6-dehydratase
MIYFIDIDNTICKTSESDYYNSEPIKARIEKINAMYRAGHTIIYWTARGSNSGIDWQDFTDNQLNSWGCLRHQTILGKPKYDYYVDDKAINSDLFFQ